MLTFDLKNAMKSMDRFLLPLLIICSIFGCNWMYCWCVRFLSRCGLCRSISFVVSSSVELDTSIPFPFTWSYISAVWAFSWLTFSTNKSLYSIRSTTLDSLAKWIKAAIDTMMISTAHRWIGRLTVDDGVDDVVLRRRRRWRWLTHFVLGKDEQR